MSKVPSIPLPEVATIVMGQSPPGSTYNENGGGLPFFQGKAEFGEVSPTPRKWCSAPQRIAEAGDILMSVRAPVGPTNLAAEQCCIGRGLAAIRADATKLDSGYLRYFLKFVEPKLTDMGQGSTFSAIGRSEISSLHIPLPPLDEQRQIVDLLSRAEGIVRLRREAQKKAAEIIPALFLDMFGDPATNPKGWNEATIGQVIVSADYGSSTKATDQGPGLPVIRMGNVDYAGNLDLSDLKFVQLPHAESARYRLEKGDLLFNRTNSKELVGKTGLWDGEIEAIAASYFIRVRVDQKKTNPVYVWAFMNTPHMKHVLFETARGAIGQANINAKELRAFHIPAPPIDLQSQFEGRSRQLQAIERQQCAAAVTADATFIALLGRVFSLADESTASEHKVEVASA